MKTLLIALSFLSIALISRAQSTITEYYFAPQSGEMDVSGFLYLDTSLPLTSQVPLGGSIFTIPWLQADYGWHNTQNLQLLTSVVRSPLQNVGTISAPVISYGSESIGSDGGYLEVTLQSGTSNVQQWAAVSDIPNGGFNDGAGIWVPVAVPEPSTVSLFLLAALGLALKRLKTVIECPR